MTKKVLVPIADGTEEIEAVCIVDVLRRAGAEVTVASVEKELQITASRGVKIVADARIEECTETDYDLIALPGGMPGAERLRDSTSLSGLLKEQRQRGKPYAAICAAPAVALQPHGLLDGRKATTHPGFVDRLKDAAAAENRVVVDGVVVTSRAPGTAIEFALALVALLFGPDKADAVAEPMLVAGR
ncbi:MAG: DJ-1/PfpI family protein [Desulfobacterales bacterium]|jgi:4-methyl-5(b-hydroxyethyl)-thiazole monophosphate biosynthesis